MILQALARYHDILANDPDSGVPRFGYSIENVSFALNLSPKGEILDVFPLFEEVQRGKKTVEVPRRMEVPAHVKRSSGIAPNFICDNCAYVLGVTDKEARDPEYASKRFEAFRRLNTELLTQLETPTAKAVVAYLAGHDPQKAADNPTLCKYLEEILKGGNLVFRLDGSSGFVHEDPQIREVWETHKQDQAGQEYTGQCLVSGKVAPIARLHPSIKGIRGANSTGASLVSFNERAYESYNRGQGQGLNSPVGEKSAFAYTTVLNFMLSSGNRNRKLLIGDTSVVYWAESRDRVYETAIMSLFQPDPAASEEEQTGPVFSRDPRAERLLQAIAGKVMRAEAIDSDSLPQGVDLNTRFYVLGLAPNAARISVRFFHQDRFEKVVSKILAHYADLEIIKEYENQPTHIPAWQILDETVSRHASDKKASPLMAGAVMRAILGQTPYPAALYYAIINRVRADMDDENNRNCKINYTRAAIIKAYLTRKYCRQNQNQIKEVLSVSLNEESNNQAYLLGRLFAVLEKAQQDAAGSTSLNATIKDRYFTSACAAPATVFPVLLRLAQHHISKADYGYVSDRRIQEIMDHLNVDDRPFPAHLSLDEQGIFILGYYHQRVAFYTSRKDDATADSVASES